IIILAIATVVFVLNLEGALISLSLLLQIVFFLAIAVVAYMFWRDRMRHDIDTWSDRSRRVFYGSFALILADLAVYFWPGRDSAYGAGLAAGDAADVAAADLDEFKPPRDAAP